MEEDEIKLLEEYLAHQMLQLSVRFYIINKASKQFKLPKDLVRSHYFKVRTQIGKKALKRALIYLIIGSMALFIGIRGTFGVSSKVLLWGALLVGSGSVITSLGLFILSFKGYMSFQM